MTDPPPLVLIRPSGIYGSELVVTDPGRGYQQAIPLDEDKLHGMNIEIAAALARLSLQRKRSNP